MWLMKTSFRGLKNVFFFISYFFYIKYIYIRKKRDNLMHSIFFLFSNRLQKIIVLPSFYSYKKKQLKHSYTPTWHYPSDKFLLFLYIVHNIVYFNEN